MRINTMNMIKQHLISGFLSRAFQFTITRASYNKIILSMIFTNPPNRPNIDVEAPTDL